MTKYQTIGITGSTGFIGSALSMYLEILGYEIINFTSNKKLIEKNSKYRFFDLIEKNNFIDFNGIDCLIHCAYLKENKQNNISGSGELFKQAKAAGVKKIVFLSSMSAMKNAVTGYGQQKYEIEKLLDHGSDFIIKPGLVIGNGGLFYDMLKFMKKWKAVPIIDGGKQFLQSVCVEDLVKTVEISLTHDINGACYLASDEKVTYKEFYESIFEKLKLKPIFIPIPYRFLMAGIYLSDFLHVKLPVSKDTLLGLKHLKFQEVSESLKHLGVQPHSYREALEKLGF